MTDDRTPETVIDFAECLRAPHLLVSGTTGSGKSVMLRGMISEALRDPRAELVLIDPKRVDLRRWKRAAVIYADTVPDTLRALDAVAYLMERRYKALARQNAVKVKNAPVYVFIDELADIMLSDLSKRFRAKLQHVLQLGRAADIHVISATQAPSRKVIPAEVVLNFTNRLALRWIGRAHV